MTGKSITYDDWVDWFLGLPSSDMVNKGSLKTLLSEFNHVADATTCETNLEREDETVFIAKMGRGGRLKLFHHYKSNRMIHAPESKATIILGMGKQNIQAFNPETEKLLKKPTIETAMPTPTSLFGITTAGGLALATGSTNLKARNFSPVPPFLLNEISDTIKAKDGAAIYVLTAAITAIQAFDAANIDNDEFSEKAKDECLQFIQWLYAATLDESPIEGIITELCEDEIILKKYEGITAVITGTQQQATPAASFAPQNFQTEAMVVSQIATQEALQNMLSFQKEKAKVNKSIFKLAPMQRKMLQVAGSTGEAISETIAESGMEFYSSANEKQAIIYMNSVLEQHNINVTVPAAMVNQLLHGALRWESQSKPSGLAACCLEIIEVERRETLNESLVIDLTTRFAMTPETIEKLTKSHVVLPKTTDDLIERLRALGIISVMLWGESARIPKQLAPFVQWLRTEQLTIASREVNKPGYIAQIMVSIDYRINLWLKSCTTATTGIDTADFHIDFSDMIRSIQHDTFQYTLPRGIQELKRDRDGVKDSEIDRDNKRHKGAGSDRFGRGGQSISTRNFQMEKAWTLGPTENYSKVFANKVIGAPTLSMGCKGCHRWHNRGTCFKGCANEKSHTKLTGRDYQDFDAYMKKCRKESS